MKVLAAVDNSAAARPVLVAARAVGRLLGVDVEAVHVRTDGERVARSESDAARVSLRIEDGDAVERLRVAADDDEVLAVVVGARGMRPVARPAGSTALAIITATLKPVVVVPPHATVPDRFRRLLLPLAGTWETSAAPQTLLGRVGEEEVDVVCLHVRDTVPAFADQPKYEAEAWADEFLARYWAGPGVPRLETRVGLAHESVLAVTEEFGADLIVLGWAQKLAPGRAAVVREVLERGSRPVALVPLVGAQ
jgi:nucleotide-binding universal stress UspA family protein